MPLRRNEMAVYTVLGYVRFLADARVCPHYSATNSLSRSSTARKQWRMINEKRSKNNDLIIAEARSKSQSPEAVLTKSSDSLYTTPQFCLRVYGIECLRGR